VRTVVLVEGTSDRAAIETLAAVRDVDLAAAGIEVVAMGGATSIRHFLARHAGDDVRLAGLCDAAEEGWFRRGLEHAGYGRPRDRCDLEALGFFVCDADLEDELIRALGVAGVEEVIAREGQLGSLRTLRRQPAQRDRLPHEHLHRFLSARSGNKERFAPLLVGARELDRVPPVLHAVLDHALR
jgi:hypothetical protein